ncbi:MAG: DNA cytosine methyltransferase [Planctomycetes bacterium]|nr:DNA cytosine methyltransferase [Planctomycetota bacterium]
MSGYVEEWPRKVAQRNRAGRKPHFDERNTLALEAVDIALKLQPRMIVFENVPEMEYALVESDDGRILDLMDAIADRLSVEYCGNSKVVEFANLGVPQRRQRLITVFMRRDFPSSTTPLDFTVLPPATHSPTPDMFTKPWVTVSQALAGVPPLDGGDPDSASCKSVQYHRVPVLDTDKYFWVSNTPPGRGAFDNQCANPSCLFAGNPTHGSRHDTSGINRANKTTPIRCVKCGSLLPRPWVIERGEHRLMSGFTSAYKRMRRHRPARSPRTSHMHAPIRNCIPPNTGSFRCTRPSSYTRFQTMPSGGCGMTGRHCRTRPSARSLARASPRRGSNKSSPTCFDN